MAAIHRVSDWNYSRGLALAAVCSVAMIVAGCKGGTSSARVAPETFSSQDAAGRALYEAAKASDSNALIKIFGSDAKDVVLSGDPVDDKNSQTKFVAAYDQMHRWDKLKNGGYVLTVGASNYPMPIPLVANSSGQWYFDGAAGRQEVLARRVGQNELDAIDVLWAIGDAQEDYFSELHDGSQVPQYAQKLVSDPGKQNGLY